MNGLDGRGVRVGTWGSMTREVGSYSEDNGETARFEGDDIGLPESPIYSNFTRHLWRAHMRHRRVQSPNRSGESTSGHRPSQDEKPPDR